MKRIYKTRLSRLIALTLTFCMVFHMLPVNIFADDITSPGAIGLEIKDLEQEIRDLESQVEELLEVPMTTAVRATADTTTATQEYVVDGATIGTFTFDVASQTITKYTASTTPPNGELITVFICSPLPPAGRTNRNSAMIKTLFRIFIVA